MRRLLLALLALLLLSAPAFSLWKTLKTEAFTVFYPEGREREAGEILEVLEYYRPYAGELVGAPARRVSVVLEDVGTSSNGLTDVLFHRILLFPSPPAGSELGYHQNWWRLVGVHEYTHWSHLSAAGGLPAVLTTVFGNTLVPANYTPAWFKEGICVVAESGTSPYEGRLNEGLFDAYASTLAQSAGLPGIVQATYNMDAFPGGTGPYLYGGEFVEFLFRRFAPDQVSRFFVHYGASLLSYLSPLLPAAGLDRSAREVFGCTIRDLWLEWQLESKRQSVSFSHPGPAVTDQGWWLGSPVCWNGGVYYQRTFPQKPAAFSTVWQHQLMRFDPDGGTSLVLLRSPAPFTGPMRIRSGTLYYALQEMEGGYDNHLYDGFGTTSELYSLDLETGAGGRLFTEPFRSFEVLEDGAILTAEDRRDEFGSVIRLHDPQRGTSEVLLVTQLLISDIVADSRNIFVAAQADWENTRIYRVDLPGWSGRGASLSEADPALMRLEPLHDTPFQEAGLCLAAERLYYSATYGSRRTVYAYDRAGGSVYRSVGSDYARSPAWDEDSGSLYYIGLSAQGEDLYREKPRERGISVTGGASLRGVPSAADRQIPEAAIRRGGYLDNLATLLPRTLFPVFALDIGEGTCQAGAGVAGTSALGDFGYTVRGYYDSVDRQPEVEAGLQTNILAPLIASFGLSTADDDFSAQYVDLSLDLQWPLLRRMSRGFSAFSLGTAAVLEWDSSGEQARSLMPYGVIGLRGGIFDAALRSGVLFYDDSEEPSTAQLFLPGLTCSIRFLGAELSLQIEGLRNPRDLPAWEFPWVPPGYDEALSGSRGAFIASSLSVPLLRLRGGLWNPGLYFGDLFLVPYAAFAINQDRDVQLSYGGTLHLELKIGAVDAGYPLDLYAGLGLTLEGRLFPLLGIQIPGYGGYVGGERGAHPRP
ncbi:MAG: hypothetical protein JXB06_04215, partial [Spirochaetales bacterium]|nr:hypothetical protein [Spirochaetales bacterium]